MKINPRFIVNLDKFAIGLPYAEEIETNGKYLVFRESMAVDNTLYSKCGCSVVDDSFIKKIIGVYTDSFAQEERDMIMYAIKHKLNLPEVKEYQNYCKSTDSPMNANKWRNSQLNKQHGTIDKTYIPNPPESYYERLEDALAYGEYRLGVFTN